MRGVEQVVEFVRTDHTWDPKDRRLFLVDPVVADPLCAGVGWVLTPPRGQLVGPTTPMTIELSNVAGMITQAWRGLMDRRPASTARRESAHVSEA